MKLRNDGWPETLDSGPLQGHSNVYVGFYRQNDEGPSALFVTQESVTGKWLDSQSLARVRDQNQSPISYYDAVLEIQTVKSADKWRPITYIEVHERNIRVDAGIADRKTSTVWVVIETAEGTESDRVSNAMTYAEALALSQHLQDTVTMWN